MSGLVRSLFLPVAAVLICTSIAAAQSGDVCREFGATPGRDLGDDGHPIYYVYGRVVIRGLDPAAEPPKVTAQFTDSRQLATRQRLGRSGNYCFRRYSSAGTLVIEVNGLEAFRRSLPDVTGTNQREDVEIDLADRVPDAPPGVVPATPANKKTIELYKRAAAFEQDGRVDKAIETLGEIVRIDPEDAVAWTKLGALNQTRNNLPEAETAFKRALALRKDYVPALMNIGILKAIRKDYPAAAEFFLQATVAAPANARAFRLLGEAYLLDGKGSPSLEALAKCLALDPVGMADAHLLKARVLDRDGAKKQAADEYREFLKKVPNYKEKKALEAYINENGQ